MKLVELQKASRSLREYAQESKAEPIVVTIDGKPMAVLLAIEDTDLETVSLSTNAKFLALIERSRHRHQEEGGISSDEMRKRLGVPGRRKRRAAR